jgi:hypothetical protein
MRDVAFDQVDADARGATRRIDMRLHGDRQTVIVEGERRWPVRSMRHRGRRNRLPRLFIGGQ